MNYKEAILKFAKLTLLVLFVGYYSGISLFFHTHIVDGQAVVHSHFYNLDAETNNPVKKHTHPASAYDIIQHLNKVNFEALVDVSPYETPFLLSQSIYRKIFSPDIIFSAILPKPSRGPPAC